MTIGRRHFMQATAFCGLAGRAPHAAQASLLARQTPVSDTSAVAGMTMRVQGWDDLGDCDLDTDVWIGIGRNWRAVWR